MRLQMKWLLIAIAVLAMAGTGSAGYIQSGPDAYVSEDDPANSQTSTMQEYTDVDTNAEDWGYCHCDVYTRSWAKAVDSASTDASGIAYWETSWQWQGPPSTPPGGTLSWSISADGRTNAWGDTDPGNGGSASSYAEGYSAAWIARSPGDTFSGGERAWGSVQDSDRATGELMPFGQAEEVPDTWWFNLQDGFFELFVDWELSGGDNDTVASGTSVIQVLAGAACDGATYASADGAGSNADALAQTYMVADAWPDADFTSN